MIRGIYPVRQVLSNILAYALILTVGLGAHGAGLAHPGHPGHVWVFDDQSGQNASVAIRLDQLAKAEDASSAEKLASDIKAAWLDLGGHAIDLLMDRGVRAVHAGDLALGREMFDRIILIDSDYAEVWYQRAMIFIRKEKFVEAVRDLEETIKREPRHFPAWQALAEILESVGQRAAALDAYRRVVAVHPFAAVAIKGRDRLIPLVEGRSL